MSRSTGNLVLIFWLTTSLFCSLTSEAQINPLWGDLEPGPYDVGFDRLWELDDSRIWPRSSFLDSTEGVVDRPVRVDMWYPALCNDRDPMPVETYLEMSAPSPEFEDLVFLTHRWDEYSYRGLTEDSTKFDLLMKTDTGACLKGDPVPERFPLLVYSAGWFNRSPDNTILAEFLASHGFVVAAIAQINPGLWTFSFASDARSVENQIRDLEVAIAALTRQDNVDRRKIGAMGYSTGGDVALLLQGRHPLVDAVISLYGSWSLGTGNDVVESPFFDPLEHTVPVLALSRPVDNGSEADQILDSLGYAPRIRVEIPNGDHGTFSDDPSQRLMIGTDNMEHRNTHTLMAKVVLTFVKSILKSDDSMETFVQQLNRLGLNGEYHAGRQVPSDNP